MDSNETPVWFVAVGNAWIGPLSVQGLIKKIENGEFSWAHYTWRKGMSEWKRASDVKEFSAALPQAPKKQIKEQVQERSVEVRPPFRGAKAPPAAPRIWYLHYNQSQFGPYAEDDVHQYLRVGKIHGEVFAWREGMPEWARLGKIPIFDESVMEAARARIKRKNEPVEGVSRGAAATSRQDKRTAPRRPLVAKIYATQGEILATGICRDISVGGMQVLTDRIPGAVGERVKLNISPTSGSKKALAPFTAQGVIVRVLEDGNGFSLRFEKLGEAAKRSIQSYINS